ncbi:MAG TPA: hypothetical protein VFZ65_11765 [Planctomycetota bacterium]|nr:hypothetical protein [Planctomycetota bacterium]
MARTAGSLLIALLVAFAAAGCNTIDKITGEEAKELERQQRQEQAKTTALGFGSLLCETVRDAADKVLAAQPPIATRKLALQWKVRVITDAREAMRRQDPISGLLDLWALTYQMNAFFTTGDGKDLFGDHQAVVTQAATELEAEVRRLLVANLTPEEAEKAHADVRAYAEQNPMARTFARTPLIRTALRPGGPFSWVPSLSSINVFGTGLSDTAVAIKEVSFAAEHFTDTVGNLPEITRWQLQQLLLEVVENERVVQLNDGVTRIAVAADQLAQTADALPGRVRAEAGLVLQQIEAQQATLQLTLRDTRATLAEADHLVQSVDTASKSLATMAPALESALATFEQTIRYLNGDYEGAPPPAPKAPGEKARPFDVLDFDKTAQSVTAMAAQLQQTLAELRNVVGDDNIDHRVRGVQAAAQGSIDAASGAALRTGLILLGALFAGLLALKFVPRRSA